MLLLEIFLSFCYDIEVGTAETPKPTFSIELQNRSTLHRGCFCMPLEGHRMPQDEFSTVFYMLPNLHEYFM